MIPYSQEHLIVGWSLRKEAYNEQEGFSNSLSSSYAISSGNFNALYDLHLKIEEST